MHDLNPELVSAAKRERFDDARKACHTLEREINSVSSLMNRDKEAMIEGLESILNILRHELDPGESP